MKTINLHTFDELSDNAKVEATAASYIAASNAIAGQGHTIPASEMATTFSSLRSQYLAGNFSENGQIRWPVKIEE